MAKFLRKLHSGFSMISGEDLNALCNGRRYRRYASDPRPVDLPKDPMDALRQDMLSISNDLKRTMSKFQSNNV